MKIHLIAYAPASPQRLIDLAKLAFSIDAVRSLVIIKPTSMAAQVGIPEVSKMAYKLGCEFVVLPQISDILEVLKIDKLLFIVHDSNAIDISDIEFEEHSSIGIVIQAGETPFTKNDLALGEPVKIDFLATAPPIPIADAALAIYKILMKMKNISGTS